MTTATPTTPYNVLLISSHGHDRSPARALLQATGECAVTTCATADEAHQWLDGQRADAVLVDCTHGPDILSGLAQICTCQSATPVVALGLSTDGDMGLNALRAGAHDVLFLDTLTAETLQQTLRVATTRQQKTAAIHDALVQDQIFLAESAIAFIDLPPEADIYRFITERLRQLVGEAVVGVCSYDANTDTLRLRHLLGLGHALSSLTALLGRSPAGLTFPAPPAQMLQQATSGKLVTLQGGLHEACGGRFTHEMCEMVCRIMNVETVLVTGFTHQRDFYGTAFILLPHEKAVTNVHAVETFLGLSAIALQRWQAEADLREQSLHDELTGLYNRRGFFAVAEQQIKVARRTRKPLALLYLDIDGFKQINDTYGHNAGDEALSELADICQALLRTSDIIGRLGGDEFVILAPDCPAEQSIQIMARLQERLRKRNLAHKATFTLEVSAGASCYMPPGPMTIDQLLGEADQAMYAEKSSRRAGADRQAAKR